jgi:DNA-binding response OmpR family regulator
MTAKQRVLVIDDDPAALRLTGYVFHRADYEVHVAADGAEGLSKVNEVKPDLVILDVMMPDMSGLEVCQRLRAQPATARLPIIMLSAKGQVTDKVSGLSAGADDYVSKPVDPEELLARAKALLQRAAYGQMPMAWTIALVGAKGGVGVTTVAVNVAAVLTTQGHSVVLAELRDHRGTAAHSLKMTPSQDLGSLLAMDATQIDRKEVSRRVIRHGSGLRVLAAPQYAAGHPLSGPHIEAILNALSPEAEYLILDMQAGAGEAVRLALERADQILLVTEPESFSVACARADLEAFKAWGLLDRVSLVIVSRSRSTMLMKSTEVENQLEVPVVGAIPPAPEAFHEVTRVGAPIVIAKPETLAAEALIELAGWLAGRRPVSAQH